MQSYSSFSIYLSKIFDLSKIITLPNRAWGMRNISGYFGFPIGKKINETIFLVDFSK